MSIAVDELRLASTRPGNSRLERDEVDRLLRALATARDQLRVGLAGHYPTEELVLNVEICRSLVRLWASSDHRRNVRGEFVEDAAALAFVFKNTMANLCALRWFEARWCNLLEQRSIVIAGLRQPWDTDEAQNGLVI